jgi:hypothetical protein
MALRVFEVGFVDSGRFTIGKCDGVTVGIGPDRWTSAQPKAPPSAPVGNRDRGIDGALPCGRGRFALKERYQSSFREEAGGTPCSRVPPAAM